MRASSFSESLSELHNEKEDWDAKFRANQPSEFRKTEFSDKIV